MADVTLSEFVVPELTAIWETIFADNPDAADRFLDAAFATFDALAATPRMGRARRFSHSRLRGLRSFRVEGFGKYLIFYQAVPDGIHVFHVFHGARDLEGLFSEG